MADYSQYALFFEFIRTFSPTGFNGIDRNNPLVLELETLTEKNNQFFFVADLIQVQVLFTSKRSIEIIGVVPEDVTPYHFFEATHPDDLQRHNLGRSKLFGLGQGLFIAEKGDALISSNFRIRNPYAGFSQLLFQCYLFYSSVPYKTVYVLQIHTNIDWYKNIRHGYHYYLGNDLTYFRNPDEELLQRGNILTDREFEIIRLIKSGLSSDQIAEKLFLSKHTVNKHRNNILEKTGKSKIWELIYELIERGLL